VIYLYYIICAIYSFGYAGISPLMPTMAAILFGTKSIGSIFGVLNLAYTVGIAIGPLLGGFIFDVTGSYSAAFTTASVVTGISFLLSLFLKTPKESA
jgi:OFA family oxalate/formate antiporter-like MFS transporter